MAPRVVFFQRLAEIVRDYLKKGSRVYIEGRLQTRKWQDATGNERYTTEVIAQEMQMLDKGSEGSSVAPMPPTDSTPTTPVQRTEDSAPIAPSSSPGINPSEEDEIPF